MLLKGAINNNNCIIIGFNDTIYSVVASCIYIILGYRILAATQGKSGK